jgi:HSP20 family protein
MSNITLRKAGNAGPSAPARAEWDPFREMRQLLRWDPAASWSFDAAFEVKETKDAYVFKADLPGMKEQDVDVQLNADRLTIQGRREAEASEESSTWYAYERSYGSFSRAFTLPSGIDAEHIKAELKDGVLTVLVPKTAEAQPKKIAIRSDKAKA